MQGCARPDRGAGRYPAGRGDGASHHRSAGAWRAFRSRAGTPVLLATALRRQPRGKPGRDRDEYPPAVFTQGGPGASLRLIPSSDNRSAGGRCPRNCAVPDRVAPSL
ncbi:NucA/NucB deoxyribonuclease domain-containing protein [Rhodobacter viridis]